MIVLFFNIVNCFRTKCWPSYLLAIYATSSLAAFGTGHKTKVGSKAEVETVGPIAGLNAKAKLKLK